MPTTIWKNRAWFYVKAACEADYNALAALPAVVVDRYRNGQIRFPATLVCYRRARAAVPGASFGPAAAVDEFEAWSRDYDAAQAIRVRIPASGTDPVVYRAEMKSLAYSLPGVAGEKTPSWPHQIVAHAFMRLMPAGLLHEGMGCGKSKSIVDLFNVWNCRRGLVVTVAGAVRDWPKHFATHSGVDVGVYLLSHRQRAKRVGIVDEAFADPRPTVCVVSFDTVWRPPLGPTRVKGRAVHWGKLLQMPFDFLAIDESHEVAEPGAKRTYFMFSAAANIPRRVLSSGTALRHKPENLFAQLRILDPGIVGVNYPAFCDRYCEFNLPPFEVRLAEWRRKCELAKTAGEPEPSRPDPSTPRFVVEYKNLDELHRLLNRFAIVVDESILDLPAPRVMYRYFDLSARAKRIYIDLFHKLEAVVNEAREKLVAPNVLSLMLRLQQATSGYAVPNADLKTETDGDEPDAEIIDDGKQNVLDETLRAIAPAERVVVFCRFKHDMTRIADVAKKNARPYFEESGRVKQRGQWDETPGAVLGANMKSASSAIDLTRSAYGIFYSVGHSLYQYQQARKRQDRPGQTRHPTFVHIVASETIDADIYDAIERNEDVQDFVVRGIGGGGNVNRTRRRDANSENLFRTSPGVPAAGEVT